MAVVSVGQSATTGERVKRAASDEFAAVERGAGAAA
jgi:hypothetical protein